MQIHPYPSYRKTDLPWLGQIPAHWEIMRLKFLITTPVTDGPHETPSFLPDGIPFLSVDSIQEGELDFENCRYISPEDHSRYKQKVSIKRGDILLGKSASTGKIAQVKVDFEFNIWSPLALIRLNQTKANPTYIEYVLKSPELQTEIDFYCNSNTQKNISMQDIPILNCMLPPLPEQQSIAAYLDRQTAKIDALIAKKERLLDLLAEQRAALISQAVTEGLNPDVKMKDSGMTWLGQVPNHWLVTQFKRVAQINYGLTLELDRTETEGTNIISLPNVTKDGQLLLDDVPLTPLTIDQKKKLLLQKGDLLFNWRNGSADHVGKTAFFDADGEYTHVSFLLRIRFESHKHDSRYFHMFLNNLRNTEFFSSSKSRVNKSYNQTELGNLIVMVPPFDEQKQIAEYLRVILIKTDELVAKVETAIGRLQEYRAALISSAVTGKIQITE